MRTQTLEAIVARAESYVAVMHDLPREVRTHVQRSVGNIRAAYRMAEVMPSRETECLYNATHELATLRAMFKRHCDSRHEVA